MLKFFSMNRFRSTGNCQSEKPVILIVEDNEFNSRLTKEYSGDIDVVCVETGEHALSVLQDAPKRFSAVFLGGVNPGNNGVEVLSKIKADESINRIPLIMKTTDVTSESVIENLNAGAHYYLSEPFDKQEFSEITSTAIRDHQHYTHIHKCLRQSSHKLQMMQEGKFSFKTLGDGRNLAVLLANACPEPDNVVLGLTELMINAVEHGNLGIGYDEKTNLNATGEWENEISRRLTLSSNRDKHVTIEFTRNQKEIVFLITDEGCGFDWRKYMEISPERASHSHGRGIAMAKLISFDQIKYLGSGNTVRVTINKK